MYAPAETISATVATTNEHIGPVLHDDLVLGRMLGVVDDEHIDTILRRLNLGPSCSVGVSPAPLESVAGNAGASAGSGRSGVQSRSMSKLPVSPVRSSTGR